MTTQKFFNASMSATPIPTYAPTSNSAAPSEYSNYSTATTKPPAPFVDSPDPLVKTLFALRQKKTGLSNRLFELRQKRRGSDGGEINGGTDGDADDGVDDNEDTSNDEISRLLSRISHSNAILESKMDFVRSVVKGHSNKDKIEVEEDVEERSGLFDCVLLPDVFTGAGDDESEIATRLRKKFTEGGDEEPGEF